MSECEIVKVVVDTSNDLSWLEEMLKISGWKRKDNLELDGVTYRPWQRGFFKKNLLLIRTRDGKA